MKKKYGFKRIKRYLQRTSNETTRCNSIPNLNRNGCASAPTIGNDPTQKREEEDNETVGSILPLIIC
jgi:hypothetical protein